MLLNATILMAILSFNFSDSLTFVGARLHSLVTLPNEYVIQKVEGNTLKTWVFGVFSNIHLPNKKTYSITHQQGDTAYQITVTRTTAHYEGRTVVGFNRYRVKPLKDWNHGLKLSFLSGISLSSGLRFSTQNFYQEEISSEGDSTERTGKSTQIEANVGLGLHAGLQLSKKLWGRQIALQFITTLTSGQIGLRYREERTTYTEGAHKSVLTIKTPLEPYIAFSKYGGPMMGVFSIYLMVQL